MTLEEFVKARLDEDEQVARAAACMRDEVDPARDLNRGHWEVINRQAVHGGDQDGVWTHIVRRADTEPVAVHIARHDPARVLADVKAKRTLIVELDSYGGPETADAYYVVLRHLATVYDTHPDYQDDWRLW
ncbi:DUF6221 family protein [Spirillospora sp. NBC_01491]|uniref:DUF6221 family protein n=1 Tax=Spirillospora sp. NBC_01491 TaxID=2976007 RepID=UPI002E32ACA3|nr:DUF6221 family protein [Spirillospora sp. NBC_01491]